MKKAILILSLTTITHVGYTQKIPMSDKGYWVIESNVKTPKISIIKFYNQASQLVYQETVKGKKVKVDNNRTRKVLNEVLSRALEAQNTGKPLLATERVK